METQMQPNSGHNLPDGCFERDLPRAADRDPSAWDTMLATDEAVEDARSVASWLIEADIARDLAAALMYAHREDAQGCMVAMQRVLAEYLLARHDRICARAVEIANELEVTDSSFGAFEAAQEARA
jgi:hypothetical protein